MRLTESTAEDAFLVRMWLYRRGFETLWESGGPVTLAAVQQELVHRLSEASAGPEVGRIEFHVPEVLLDEEFERWPLPTRGRRLGEIGCTYEVVVRCPNERTDQSGRRWLRKWAWYRTHGGRHPDAVLPLAGGTPFDHGLAAGSAPTATRSARCSTRTPPRCATGSKCCSTPACPSPCGGGTRRRASGPRARVLRPR